MALQLSALRDALLSAGAPPNEANKAAEEVARWQARHSVMMRLPPGVIVIGGMAAGAALFAAAFAFAKLYQ